METFVNINLITTKKKAHGRGGNPASIYMKVVGCK